MTLRMGDGPPANLPDGLDAYAGYVDHGGIGVTYPQVVAGWPAAHHLSISIHGNPAMCGDVESGALDSWAGYDYGYSSTSNAGALILRYGRPRRLWTAHYGIGPHICTSQQCWPSSPVGWTADGTQWTTHGNTWDESLLSDNFFDPPGGADMPLTQADADLVAAAVAQAVRQLFVPGNPAGGTPEGELYGRTRTAAAVAVTQAAPAIAAAVKAALPVGTPAVGGTTAKTVTGTFTGTVK